MRKAGSRWLGFIWLVGESTSNSLDEDESEIELGVIGDKGVAQGLEKLSPPEGHRGQLRMCQSVSTMWMQAGHLSVSALV